MFTARRSAGWALALSLVGVVLVAALPAPAAPELPPRPATAAYVNDFAGLLDAGTRNELSEIGRALDEKTGAEVVVVTVPSLGGSTIEDYALQLFRAWGLGEREKNNGVLLLVDKERLLSGESGKVRIEVGYGLEGAIPDGRAGRILDERVLPLWQEKKYAAGIRAGYLAVAAAVAEEYQVDLSADRTLSVLDGYRAAERGSDGLPWELLPLLFFLFIFLMSGWGRRRRRGIWWWGGFGGGGWGGFGGGFGGGGFGGGSSGGGGASR